jgi:hypothetical protein
MSARETKIVTKLVAAEKIPKSYTEKALATKRVKRKLQKAEVELPTKSMAVSFMVPEKSADLAKLIYFLTTLFYYSELKTKGGLTIRQTK